MNQELWNKIIDFDFNQPEGEYGFIVRLANENYWTQSFTDEAVLEYKKFMYLAATSEFMVSPSETVDTVWHQHLIFTQSYQDFCSLVGKQIQHLPSTHNPADAEKFKQAKQRTRTLYEAVFGLQPKNIWEYNDMYGSLRLKKASFKLRSFIVAGIIGFLMLLLPVYYLLKPLYIRIPNPRFIVWLAVLSGIVFLILAFFNKAKLSKIVAQFDPESFAFQLTPFELMYCKTQKLSDMINSHVNELVKNKTIIVNKDYSIALSNAITTNNDEQRQIVAMLFQLGITFYPNLLQHLSMKPIFWNTSNCMEAFKKYCNKSKKFGQLFYINFMVLALLSLLSFSRIFSGMFVAEKPVTLIVLATVALIGLSIAFLNRLTNQLLNSTLPNFYRNNIISKEQLKNNAHWRYSLLGATALTATFIPLANYVNRHNDNTNGSSCGTSCGSSCGSSCSSCGGCGGD